MFGKHKEEKQAHKAAAQAELDRLKALSPEGLAVEVLPLLAKITTEHKNITYANAMVIMLRFLDGYHGAGASGNAALNMPVRDALQRLEHANLVERKSVNEHGSDGWRVTDLGQQALAAGDVAARLARITG
jgi:hypothetical protein